MQEMHVQRLSRIHNRVQPPAPLVGDRRLWLSQHLATRVTLTWTNNRTAMITVRGNHSSGYRVRVQQIFHQAPEPVWIALVAYIRGTDAAAGGVLRAYIKRQQSQRDTPRQPQQRQLQPRGQYFDLNAIYRALNAQYFANRVQANITWSRQAPKRQRSSIRFGSYHHDDRLIRIHRALDQAFVPRYVVEHVVFHEMLHQLIPRQRINGRWYVHPPAFRQHEQCFPAFQQATQWQQRYLTRLLSGAQQAACADR